MTAFAPEQQARPDWSVPDPKLGFAQPQRTLRALEAVDMMPPGLRACVHEFGYPIVNACINAGVRDPKQVRQLVYEIWQGARQPHQTTGDQGSKTLAFLDWVLTQAGAKISARLLVRLLWQKNMVLLPREPSPGMVDASMAAIENMGPLTKSRKHHLRLRAAIKAASQQWWPHLTDPHA